MRFVYRSFCLQSQRIISVHNNLFIKHIHRRLLVLGRSLNLMLLHAFDFKIFFENFVWPLLLFWPTINKDEFESLGLPVAQVHLPAVSPRVHIVKRLRGCC